MIKAWLLKYKSKIIWVAVSTTVVLIVTFLFNYLSSEVKSLRQQNKALVTQTVSYKNELGQQVTKTVQLEMTTREALHSKDQEIADLTRRAVQSSPRAYQQSASHIEATSQSNFNMEPLHEYQPIYDNKGMQVDSIQKVGFIDKYWTIKCYEKEGITKCTKTLKMGMDLYIRKEPIIDSNAGFIKKVWARLFAKRYTTATVVPEDTTVKLKIKSINYK